MNVSIPHGGFFVGKAGCRELWQPADRSQSPTGDFLLGRGNATPQNSQWYSLNPPRGIFCWEGKAKAFLAPGAFVSIPHGGFFVGKGCGVIYTTVTVSQSPTGDFLLGRTSQILIKDQLNYYVSIPHGGFFVGKVTVTNSLVILLSSQSPTGDFLLGSP